MEIDEAFSLIAEAIDSKSKSGGYLVVGDIKGNCTALVKRVLAKLFPVLDFSAPERPAHPDIAWLDPAGKSRTIKVKPMREEIIQPMESTSYSGGWKVGVITGADRMQTEAANAFLKSLEEPTPKTLFFLLTDRPDALLPTIISRCQRIDLKLPPGGLTGKAAADVEAIFRRKDMSTVLARAMAAKSLAEILAALKKEADDEDVPLVRKAFFQSIMAHVRKWMVSSALPRHLAFRNVEAVEEAYARTEKHISEESVLAFMMDKLVFPPSPS